MAGFGLSATSYVTASTQVVATTKVVRLFCVHIITSGATPAVVNFNSNGSGGTIYLKETGTASTGKTINYGQAGVVFPQGFYIGVDGNTTSVVATYRVESV